MHSAFVSGLKSHRKEQQLTQAILASAVSLSVPTIHHLEQGKGHVQNWLKVLQHLELEVRGRNLPKVDPSIGQALAVLRHRRKLSQSVLSKQLQVSPSTLIRLEKECRGRLDVLDKALTLLGAGAYLAKQSDPIAFYTGVGNSSQGEEWHTPPDLLEKLYRLVEFDLDPCSPAQPNVKTKVHFTKSDDGLSLEWFGNVFLNPPYGSGLKHWIAKAHTEQSNTQTIWALIPSRTDTQWWHNHIAGHADVFFLKGRLRFSKSGTAAPFPSALVIWGATSPLLMQVQQAFPNAWCSSRI